MGAATLNVPFELQVWSAERCAAYLEQEKSTFLKRTQFVAGFPARLGIPGQPRWSAKEVAEWALSRQNHGKQSQLPDSVAT